ncbi:MAG: OB-fold nucleic acid binding domain-containing protein [Candidatus Thorarchaeota archaeon]|jgi:ssDNA-binding replication factor A large subunit
MLTLEETIERILKNRTDLERKDILKMIEEKRQELGPEVINDESAAMIVARELGVDLHQMSASSRLKIEDITETTRNAAITARVDHIEGVRTFTKKDGGGEGKVTSIRVSDDSGSIKVVLWDDLTKIVDENLISIDDVIQVRGGFVRKGLGESLELSLGRMGHIRQLEEYEIEELGIEFGASQSEDMKISDLKEGLFGISVIAKIQRVFRLSTFTRQRDGSEGRVLSMIVADDTGSARFVFWDDSATEMENAEQEEVIRLRNVNTRPNRDGTEVEVHVGRSSTIERNLKDKIDAVEGVPIGGGAEPLGKKDIADLMPGMGNVDIEGKVVTAHDVREFTTKDGKDGRVRNLVLADESGTTRVAFWNEDIDKIVDIKEGDIVKILHGYVKEGYRGGVEFGAGRKSEILINPKGSKLKKLDVSQVAAPIRDEAESLGIKDIADLSTGMWDVDIEGKVVTVYDVNTFTTKDNKEGRVRNLILADESGQTRVTFWNDDVDKIVDIKEDDIVKILHGYVKEGYRGGIEFQVGKKAEIEINPKGSKLKKLDVSQVSLQPLTKAARVPIGDVGDNYEDKNVEVCGIVVNLSQSMSPIYQACPSCNKKLDGSDGEYICKSCGKVKSPEPRMLYKITVDDGSGSIRVTLFGKVGEELLQMTAKEADEIIKKSGVAEQPLIDNSEKVVGKYISVYGRIKKYRESLDLSANGFEFADPVREVKRLKEEIQKEVA